MKNSSQYTQNNFMIYLLILLTFFILLFFTKNIFFNVQISLDTQSAQELELSQKQTKLSQLNTLKNDLSQDGSEALEKIKGFSGTFSDADILEYIYDYAQKVNFGNDKIIIRDLKLTEEGVSDMGFKKATVSISAVVSSEATLFSFMDYLTSSSATYRFYIQDFDYPINQGSGNIQVSLPLTLYYK